MGYLIRFDDCFHPEQTRVKVMWTISLSKVYELHICALRVAEGIPLHTPVLLYKSGVTGGIHFTDMFS